MLVPLHNTGARRRHAGAVGAKSSSHSRNAAQADCAPLLAPQTSGPRDVPRCGALSLLQKDAALQGGIQLKPL